MSIQKLVLTVDKFGWTDLKSPISEKFMAGKKKPCKKPDFDVSKIENLKKKGQKTEKSQKAEKSALIFMVWKKGRVASLPLKYVFYCRI